MTRHRVYGIGTACLALFAGRGFRFPGQAGRRFPRRRLVNKYCVSCHNQKLKTANLMLDRADSENVANSAETWEKVIVKLRSRAMPPAGMPRPDNATYDSVAALAGIRNRPRGGCTREPGPDRQPASP